MEPEIIAALIGAGALVGVALLTRKPSPKSTGPSAKRRGELYRYIIDAMDDLRRVFDDWIESGGPAEGTAFSNAAARLANAAKDAQLGSPRPVVLAVYDVLEASERLTKLAVDMAGNPDPSNPDLDRVRSAYDDARAKFIVAAREDLGAGSLAG